MMITISQRTRVIVAVCCTALAILLCKEMLLLTPSSTLSFSVFDVGQGDALFIQTPHGKQILIDAGPDNVVLKELSRYMSFFDRTIDMVVITNPDKDHIAGFIDVFSRYRVGVILEPGTVSTTDIWKRVDKAIEEEVREEDAARMLARRGMNVVLDTDTTLTILFPDRNVSSLSTNTGSIIAKVTYKNTSILLTGDTTESVEKYLVEFDNDSIPLKSDILKVAHHGSRTSTSDVFIQAVSPKIAIISAGKNNRYGHPHADVIERLTKYQISVFGTYNTGTVQCTSNGILWSCT